jgi:TatD DNase family protein
LKPLPYLDIHTHRRNLRDDAVGVGSLSAEEILQGILSLSYSTAGIHPWWPEDLSNSEISNLKLKVEQLLLENRLWGIGETGLDRTSPEFLEQQRELFYWHLDLSERFHLPLVIHSVRSGSDFLQILKERRPSSPWIFHDFRGNETLLKDLLRLHPECYFSFGLSVDNSQPVRELLPLVPLDRLFLETDEQKHLDIHDIYLRASHFLGVDPDFLKSQVWLNFKRITDRKVQ